MHSKPDLSSEILRKLTTSDMFFVFGLEGNWYEIDVYVKDKPQETYGYIHKSRVKFIHEYDSVSLSNAFNDKIFLKNSTVQVEVKTKLFDHKANTIQYNADGYVESINHKRVWGTDGGLPKISYEYIWVTIDGNKIVLPTEAYDNLYQPDFRSMRVYYDHQNDVLYIQGLNSDGAGAYTFAIILKNKKFERTVAMIPF